MLIRMTFRKYSGAWNSIAQEKAQAFQDKKIDGRFVFTRDKTVYVNHYYFCMDDDEFGPLWPPT
jgi:hypothetical protein